MFQKKTDSFAPKYILTSRLEKKYIRYAKKIAIIIQKTFAKTLNSSCAGVRINRERFNKPKAEIINANGVSHFFLILRPI